MKTHCEFDIGNITPKYVSSEGLDAEYPLEPFDEITVPKPQKIKLEFKKQSVIELFKTENIFSLYENCMSYFKDNQFNLVLDNQKYSCKVYDIEVRHRPELEIFLTLYCEIESNYYYKCNF